MNKFLFVIVFILSGCAAGPNAPEQNKLQDMLVDAEFAYEQARLNDAETAYKKIVEYYPNYSDGWFKLGNIYARQGRYKAATYHYERVLALSPDDARAWYNLSIVKINEAKLILAQATDNIADDSGYNKSIYELQISLTELSRRP